MVAINIIKWKMVELSSYQMYTNIENIMSFLSFFDKAYYSYGFSLWRINLQNSRDLKTHFGWQEI